MNRSSLGAITTERTTVTIASASPVPSQDIDTVLLKTASRCNLDCTYCYVYNMGDDGWRSQPKRMSAAVIDAVIDQVGRLSHVQDHPVSVVLHGGEPLLLGLGPLTHLVGGLRESL